MQSLRGGSRLAGIGTVLALCAALTTAVALAAPASADPLAFTISNSTATRLQSAPPVSPISPGFVGASIDYCSITHYAGTPAADRVLAHLLEGVALEQPVLRIGGDGPEAPCPDHIRRSVGATTGEIGTLVRALGATLILGINLVSHDPYLARYEVATLIHAIDPRPPYSHIGAFEIGNEADLLPQYGPNVPAAAVGPYFEQFLRDFEYWTRAIRAITKDPSFPVAGPSLGRFGLPWITGPLASNFGAFVNSPAKPHLITFHTYPLFGVNDPCPSTSCASIENLLSEGASHGLAAGLAQFVRRAPPGHTLRVDEMNSITGGGTPGVSNTFASALWALDTTFEMASVGVSGVNFHTFPGAAYALFDHPTAREWFVHPEYYGLLMFARAAPTGARLLSVSGANGSVTQPASAPASVKVWATRDAEGTTRIVIINKDIQAHDVLLDGPGLPANHTASVQVLRAPPTPDSGQCPAGYGPTGLCATGGVSLGGRSFGVQENVAPFGDRTVSGLLAPPAHRCDTPFPSGCVLRLYRAGGTIEIPPATAVLLTGDWSGQPAGGNG